MAGNARHFEPMATESFLQVGTFEELAPGGIEGGLILYIARLPPRWFVDVPTVGGKTQSDVNPPHMKCFTLGFGAMALEVRGSVELHRVDRSCGVARASCLSVWGRGVPRRCIVYVNKGGIQLLPGPPAHFSLGAESHLHSCCFGRTSGVIANSTFYSKILSRVGAHAMNSVAQSLCSEDAMNPGGSFFCPRPRPPLFSHSKWR